MKNVLERIYYEWCCELEDEQKVIDANENLSVFDEKIEKALGNDFFKYDDAVMEFVSQSQKQGFMAGFEIARQIMTGGR